MTEDMKEGKMEEGKMEEGKMDDTEDTKYFLEDTKYSLKDKEDMSYRHTPLLRHLHRHHCPPMH